MSIRTLTLACAIALVAAPIAFADEPTLAAVLPLDVTNAGGIDRSTQVSLDEAIRTIAGDTLFPLGFTVLNSETTLAVLADNGIDAAKACESSCALDAARELKAHLLVSGTLTKTEGTYVAYVRLFESASGKQAGSVILEGATVRELRKAFEEKAPTFFARAKSIAPKKATAPVEPPVVVESGGSSAPMWIAAGVAVLAGGAGGYFGMSARSAMGEREVAQTTAAFEEAGKRAESDSLTANILFGTGGVAALTSILMWALSSPPAEAAPSPSAPNANLSIFPSLDGSAASLAVTTSF